MRRKIITFIALIALSPSVFSQNIELYLSKPRDYSIQLINKEGLTFDLDNSDGDIFIINTPGKYRVLYKDNYQETFQSLKDPKNGLNLIWDLQLGKKYFLENIFSSEIKDITTSFKGSAPQTLEVWGRNGLHIGQSKNQGVNLSLSEPSFLPAGKYFIYVDSIPLVDDFNELLKFDFKAGERGRYIYDNQKETWAIEPFIIVDFNKIVKENEEIDKLTKALIQKTKENEAVELAKIEAFNKKALEGENGVEKVFSIGDLGPAGGIIINVNEDRKNGYKYLEMQLSDLPGEFKHNQAVLEAMKDSTGGIKDWRLPSEVEGFSIFRNNYFISLNLFDKSKKIGYSILDDDDKFFLDSGEFLVSSETGRPFKIKTDYWKKYKVRLVRSF